MNSAVQGIHHNAVKHSKRAARLWRESAAVFKSAEGEAPSRDETIKRAILLNEKAVEECRQALNSLEFIRRYRESGN